MPLKKSLMSPASSRIQALRVCFPLSLRMLFGRIDAGKREPGAAVKDLKRRSTRKSVPWTAVADGANFAPARASVQRRHLGYGDIVVAAPGTGAPAHGLAYKRECRSFRCSERKQCGRECKRKQNSAHSGLLRVHNIDLIPCVVSRSNALSRPSAQDHVNIDLQCGRSHRVFSNSRFAAITRPNFELIYGSDACQ